MRARRAFIFTTDAVVAFYLITVILSLLMILSYTPMLYTQQPQSVAKDTMVALSTIKLSDVWGNPQYNYTNSLLNASNNSVLQWPMFERTIGHNTSLISVYPPSNYTWLVYQVSNGGATGVHSTPLVYNGRIIATSENGIYAFDENTGVRIWWLPIPSDSTPLIYNGRIFVGSLSNTFYSLDEMGNVIWNVTLSNSIVSSPISDNGKVFVGVSNGSLIGFNVDSGLPLNWTFTATGSITSTPVIYNNEIIIYSHDSAATHLYAIDEDTGVQLWNYTSTPVTLNLFIDPSPLVANNTVYINNEVNIDALNATTGAELTGWPVNQTGMNFTSSPTFDDQRIYIGYIDSNAGTEGVCAINTTVSPITIHPASLGSPVYASPIIVGNALILATTDGDVRLMNKSAVECGCTYQKIWQYQTGAAIYSSPAFVDGRIYIGSNDGNIYSFGNCSLWDDNMSVTDSIAAFWSIGRMDCAQAIAKEFLNSAMPQNYGFELVIRPPDGTGQQCNRILGNSCYYCNGTTSTEWDSVYTNDCSQTKYQRLLIRDSRYISGLLRENGEIDYTQSPIEVDLRVWN